MFGGVVGLFLSRTSAQQPRLVHLAQGWNLVSWTSATQSTSGALASVGDAVSAVYGYNSDSQSFARYIFGRPEVSTLTDFETERAYWVLALRPTDWSVPSGVGPSCPAATLCPYYPTPTSTADDLPGQSLCKLLDELDELQWVNLSTAFAVDCGIDLDCTLQCDLDSGFERDVDAVADFLRTSPPLDPSMWQLEHCVGPFYFP
jgi:hypothetical protein